MKIKLYAMLTLGIITLLFTSCDPGFSYSKVIMNDSKYDILVIANDTMRQHSYNGYAFDTLFVAKHSSEAMGNESGMGVISTFSSCDYFSDSVYTKIVGFDSLKLSVDLSDSSNWTYFILDESFGGGGACECRIKITDSMIK